MAKNQLLIKSSENKDEQLIALVQQNPVLYTQTHPKYMDTKYKQKVWDTIGAFMEEDTLACKARWYNIRDNYRKSIRNNLTRSGTKKAKHYKYTTQLAFLDEYVKDVMRDHVTINNDDQEASRSTLPSPTPPLVKAPTPVDESEDDLPAADSDHDDFFDDIVMKHEIHETEIEPVKDPLNASDPMPSTTTKASGSNTEDPTPIRRSARLIRKVRRPLPKRLGNSIASAATTSKPSSPPVLQTSESTDRVLELLVNKAIPTDNPDPIDAFLAGISPTLKSLHPYYRCLAKSEIFATVQKYELKMLTEPPPLFFPDQQSGKS